MIDELKAQYEQQLEYQKAESEAEISQFLTEIQQLREQITKGK